MGWKQVRAFNLSKMGHEAGMCLKNVRLAYGIPAKYASAKDDMLANKKAGTLHDISSVPKDCAVPVYADTSSPYEHVMVCDHGTYYSDGKRLSSTRGMKFFGWGETCDGVRVVEYAKDPEPTPTSDFNVGDKVTLKQWADYNGTALKKTRDFYYVKQIAGDRVTLTADSINGPVYAAVKANNLVKYNGSASTPIRVGDSVIVNGQGTGASNGGAGRTKNFTNQRMKVIAINNGRYGCNQYNKDGGITGWWAANQVRKA